MLPIETKNIEADNSLVLDVHLMFDITQFWMPNVRNHAVYWAMLAKAIKQIIDKVELNPEIKSNYL